MFYKKRAYKNIAIFAGKLLCQSLFVSCKFSKKELWHKGFSCEFLRAPSLQKTSGWLLLFYNSCWVYNLQYSWQFSSSEKSLVGKKNYFTQIFFVFNFFDKCVFILSVTQSVYYTLSRQTFCWLLTNSENFNSISNTRFLYFDGPIIYLYLFKNHRQNHHISVTGRTSIISPQSY